eukprot:TRINITY_DN283_c0_g1_i1.p2 TRINITY_DN283_c0_g1~~TRINITY_DN283_c0_g1_i1.p2  ORF type:complete len:508 (-),score=79.45 TRINITY_DN283_c0_g1_i1:1013-2536(-)
MPLPVTMYFSVPQQHKQETDIEASCVLLQSIGKELEHEEKKRVSKPGTAVQKGFEQSMEKLKKIKEVIKPTSRVRYLIINLLDRQKNGWPEIKSKKEGPKKLEELYKDIEEEKLAAEASARRAYAYHQPDYGREHESGYDYDTGRTSSPRGKMYYKKKEAPQNIWSTLEQVRSTPEPAEKKFEKEEIITKIPDHLHTYAKDPAKVSFEEFKVLSENEVEASEVVTEIMKAAVENNAISRQISKNKAVLPNYIYSFGQNKVYEYKRLIEGINKYIQSQYENDCEDNLYLKEIISNMLIEAVQKEYWQLRDIHFSEIPEKPEAETEEEKMEVYKGRIELGCEFIMGLDKAGFSKDALKEVFERLLDPMLKRADPEEIDNEKVDPVKELFSEGCPPELVEHVAGVFKEGKERKFSESFAEPLAKDEEEKKKPVFQQALGEGMWRVILEDNELNVRLLCLTMHNRKMFHGTMKTYRDTLQELWSWLLRRTAFRKAMTSSSLEQQMPSKSQI